MRVGGTTAAGGALRGKARGFDAASRLRASVRVLSSSLSSMHGPPSKEFHTSYRYLVAVVVKHARGT